MSVSVRTRPQYKLGYADGTRDGKKIGLRLGMLSARDLACERCNEGIGLVFTGGNKRYLSHEHDPHVRAPSCRARAINLKLEELKFIPRIPDWKVRSYESESS